MMSVTHNSITNNHINTAIYKKRNKLSVFLQIEIWDKNKNLFYKKKLLQSYVCRPDTQHVLNFVCQGSALILSTHIEPDAGVQNGGSGDKMRQKTLCFELGSGLQQGGEFSNHNAFS